MDKRKRRGRPSGRKLTRHLDVRIDPAFEQRLQGCASRAGMSVSEFCRATIEPVIGKQSGGA